MTRTLGAVLYRKQLKKKDYGPDPRQSLAGSALTSDNDKADVNFKAEQCSDISKI